MVIEEKTSSTIQSREEENKKIIQYRTRWNYYIVNFENLFEDNLKIVNSK